MSSSTSRKKMPKKNLSKEALQVTALKKRETTVRAMAIIERMIDDKVEEKWLLDSVHFITQDQYQDVVEERAITKLCGYPLCCGVLNDIPSKTYHISTKQNKVYDITDRKNFCCSRCYKASLYLKNQLLTSPLWLRDNEEKPEYTIFRMNEGGGLGAEIDLGHCRVRLSDVEVTSASEEPILSSENLNKSPENKSSSCVRKDKRNLISENNSASKMAPHEEGRDAGVNKAASLKSAKPSQVRFKEDESSNKKDFSKIKKEKVKVSPENATDPNSEPSNSNKCDYTKLTRSIKVSESVEAASEEESILRQLENVEIDETGTQTKLVGQIFNMKKNLKSMSVDLSFSIPDKGNSAKHTSEKDLSSEAYEEINARPSCKNESELVPQESKILKSISENMLVSKSTEEGIPEVCENKADTLLNPDEISKSENSSNLMPVGEKSTQDPPKSEHNLIPDIKTISDPSKPETSSKKRSVFKKERHKTKKPDEKIERKTILLEVVKHIEKCVREWITFDSLIFLKGEEVVKTELKSKGSDFKDCQNLCGTDASVYEKYLSICRKLNMLELEDARADAAAKEKNAELKPLPDYSLLKREAKQLEIKVRSFYEGSTRIEMDEETLKDCSKEEDNTIVLPLVDLHAQKALRRRIVLERLNVILPDLGRTLNLSVFNITSAVRNLTRTFNFSSHNITFKPPEWYFIAMVLVKLLSLQDKTMRLILESGSSEKYLTLLLMNWGLDAGYLDRLASWLTDIDYLLQKAS